MLLPADTLEILLAIHASTLRATDTQLYKNEGYGKYQVTKLVHT